MANNFYNAVRRNISADSTLPTEVYLTPNGLKSIAIELDVSNKSSAGVTVTVQLEDESLNETYDTTGTVIADDEHNISALATGVTGLLALSLPKNDAASVAILDRSVTRPGFQFDYAATKRIRSMRRGLQRLHHPATIALHSSTTHRQRDGDA